MLRLIFDDWKFIAKQNGYELGWRWLNGRRKMTKYQKQEYIAFKQAAGLFARNEVRKQGWGVPRTCQMAVFGYFFCPRRVRGHDLSDNAFSGFLDAFQGVIYDDDKRFTVSRFEKIETKKLMRVEFVFMEAEQWRKTIYLQGNSENCTPGPSGSNR